MDEERKLMKKLRITVGKKTYDVTVEVLSDDTQKQLPASSPTSSQPAAAVERAAPAGPKQVAASGAVISPMAGVVKSILVSEGDEVDAGQELLVLEAMKMDNKVTAPRAATVASVDVSEGDNVPEGHVLLVLE